MWKVRSYGTAISKCKASQKNIKQWFHELWAQLSRYIASLLNEGKILWFGDGLSGGLIEKPIPINFLIVGRQDHYWHSYYNLLDNRFSMFEIWVVSGHL